MTIPSAVDLQKKNAKTIKMRSKQKNSRSQMAIAKDGFYIDHHTITNDRITFHFEEPIVLCAEYDYADITLTVNAANTFFEMTRYLDNLKAKKERSLRRFTPVSKNSKELKKEIKEINDILNKAFRKLEIK